MSNLSALIKYRIPFAVVATEEELFLIALRADLKQLADKLPGSAPSEYAVALTEITMGEIDKLEFRAMNKNGVFARIRLDESSSVYEFNGLPFRNYYRTCIQKQLV